LVAVNSSEIWTTVWAVGVPVGVEKMYTVSPATTSTVSTLSLAIRPSDVTVQNRPVETPFL
jgi:hypothetical protein